MARQWRIEYPGALYHVFSRGNAKKDIFWSDRDRHLFLSLLETLSSRFHIDIYAYVLMTNHYHLLLKTHDANLSRAMQWFGTSFTRKFNLNNRQTGHLFQGRFKSIIVENDAYLLRLSCYIHRNPLRAGIAERLVDFPWSSFRFYTDKEKPPTWLLTQPILDQLSGKDRHKAYRIKVQQYSHEEKRIWEEVKHGLIIGSQNFVSDLKSRFLGDSKDEELPQHNSMFRDFKPEGIIKIGSETLDFDLEAARKAKKIGADEKDKRDLLIYLLWETGRLSNKEMGAIFGLTYSAISRCVKSIADRISVEPGLKDTLNSVLSSLHIINGGIMQNKGVVVRTHRSLTNCND